MRTWWTLVLVGLFFWTGGAPSKPVPSPPSAPTLQAEGVLEAAAFDSNNAVTAVAFFTDEGRYYVVALEGKGGELIQHAGKRARCQGKVRETPEGDFLLIVESYEILENGPG